MGREGLERAQVDDYDVVVLDRDLPGVHGDAICASMVEVGRRARILMLTASATIDGRVGGLGAGADDWLTKPFDVAALARMRCTGRGDHHTRG